jgi:MoaA/NifB/PqqE/SkfB family radical SAM enzyme
MSDTYTQFKGGNPFGSQAKMLHHMDKLLEYKTKGDTWPIFVEFNLTDLCNLRCEWCISENCRSQDTISTDVALQFLEDFANCGGKAVTFSGGGEPTLHPDFASIVYGAKEVGLDVALMTNGVIKPGLWPIIDETCQWVRVSLDTALPDNYKRWKGVDRTQAAIATLRGLKSTKVGVNVNVGMDYTIADLESIMALRDDVDYIQFRPILPRYFKHEKPEVNYVIWKHLQMYYGNDPKVTLSDDKLSDLEHNNLFPFRSCEGHFFNPVVQANGDVAVCMYHPKEPDYVFGNLYKHNFPRIWRSKTRKKVLEKVRCVNYREECQACCKLTELNKLTDFLNNPDPNSDINFL